MGNWTGLLSNGFLNIPINAWPILVISKKWQVRYGTFGSIPRVFNRLLHDILPQKYWRHNTCCDASMNTFIKNQWGQVPNSNWKCMIQYLYFSHFSTSPISGWRRLRGSEAPNSVFRLRSTTSVASTIFSRMASSVHQLQSARRSFMISMYGFCQIAEFLSFFWNSNSNRSFVDRLEHHELLPTYRTLWCEHWHSRLDRHMTCVLEP